MSYYGLNRQAQAASGRYTRAPQYIGGLNQNAGNTVTPETIDTEVGNKTALNFGQNIGGIAGDGNSPASELGPNESAGAAGLRSALEGYGGGQPGFGVGGLAKKAGVGALAALGLGSGINAAIDTGLSTLSPSAFGKVAFNTANEQVPYANAVAKYGTEFEDATTNREKIAVMDKAYRETKPYTERVLPAIANFVSPFKEVDQNQRAPEAAVGTVANDDTGPEGYGETVGMDYGGGNGGGNDTGGGMSGDTPGGADDGYGR